MVDPHPDDAGHAAARAPSHADALRRKTEVEGVAFAVSAYGFWGFVVILYGSLSHVGALELTAHRAVWCLLFMAIVLAFRRSYGRLWEALSSPRMLATLLFTAVLTGGNWSVFIWAVGEGRVLETSLGYYINPLVSVFLGVVLLGERLTRPQLIAIGLAGIGVAWFGFSLGVLPWVPLTLAFLFGLYGYVRKIISVGPAVGLTVESMWMVMVALPYILWLEQAGTGHWDETAWTPWLLIATGPATALPLVWFAAGAQRVRLSTMGMLQYIAPSIHFLLAILYFGETVTSAHIVTFVLIWSALAIFTGEVVQKERRARRAARAALHG